MLAVTCEKLMDLPCALEQYDRAVQLQPGNQDWYLDYTAFCRTLIDTTIPYGWRRRDREYTGRLCDAASHWRHRIAEGEYTPQPRLGSGRRLRLIWTAGAGGRTSQRGTRHPTSRGSLFTSDEPKLRPSADQLEEAKSICNEPSLMPARPSGKREKICGPSLLCPKCFHGIYQRHTPRGQVARQCRSGKQSNSND